jgi:arabinose-5-phosphate isomerase
MRWVLNCAGKTGSDVPIVSSNTQLLDALLIMSQKALGMVLITHGKTLQGIPIYAKVSE